MISARRNVQLVNSHSGLVAKLAWESWLKMPRQVRSWLDPEDLMQEVWLILLEAGSRYNGSRGMREGSFYWMVTQSTLANYAVAVLAKKRTAPGLVPVEDAALLLRDHRLSISRRVEAREALDSLYNKADEGLKFELVRWFGLGKERLRLDGKETQFQIRRFQTLARGTGLTIDDCRIGMAERIGTEWWLRDDSLWRQKTAAAVQWL